MTEPDHLRKANQLRFYFAVIALMILGVSIVGLKKFLDWRSEEKQQNTRESGSFARGTAVPDPPDEAAATSALKQRLAAVRQRTPSSTISESNATPNTTANSTGPAREISPTREPTHLDPTPSNEPIGNISTNRPGIRGIISLLGNPPPEKIIEPLRNDPVCGKGLTNVPMTRFYLVSTNGGLANVFVYVKRRANNRPMNLSLQERSLLVDQVNCLYEPFVLGATVDQPIQFRNSDSVIHNVHATPKLNSEFNFAEPTKGMTVTKRFAHEELMIRIKCDIHPWMFSYINVIEHPYFAVTDANGYFEINGLPDGEYVIEAVHQKAGTQTASVKVDRQTTPTLTRLSLVVPQN